ncbi:hypothetical protein CYLTODRAFT_441178 [Cylindrobasidium torrendii FP15055 ss-10]|uniref:FAD/NAD(P)-binding domain-containing protein n=1 Tax=Cylindrobasidium torrendii FP15055 ss-10 TaxID=1314674 RepID=A0A0D7BMR9_9AGAR|nr:hypothetical protein CYLTODRAFT_441178 [Cylindrobasidium torrendii FP15055 ss-10]
MTPALKNILVLGVAYGGTESAKILANAVPAGWRVIAIDRNTHINHAYVLPRVSVYPGHEGKAFVPNRNVFRIPTETTHPHVLLHASVSSMTTKSVTLDRSFPTLGFDSPTIDYEYAIYSLGAHLPDPLNLWARPKYDGEKPDAMDEIRKRQKAYKDAGSILVVGGGALGVQLATDINSLYPTKSVTLLHSRKQLLPRYRPEMHYEILKSMDKGGITSILGERLDLDSAKQDPPKRNEKGQRVVRTLSGREIAADLIVRPQSRREISRPTVIPQLLCTGQRPNTELLREIDPRVVNPDNALARVKRTMQLTTRRRPIEVENGTVDAATAALDKVSLATEISDEPETVYPHIFVAGDCADAFDAIQAGHTAYWQSITASHNILKLIKGEGEELEEYKPGAPAIKISLGITHAVSQVDGEIHIKDDGVEDMHAPVMWDYWGIPVTENMDYNQ